MGAKGSVHNLFGDGVMTIAATAKIDCLGLTRYRTLCNLPRSTARIKTGEVQCDPFG
jgi:hypothetical protein